MVEKILAELAPILVGLASILGTWLLWELRRWVRSRTNNELAFAALDDIEDLVRTVVSDVGQTFELAAADGKITPEEGAEMKAMAHATITSQIPPMVKRNALRLVNDLDEFVNSRIEREVVMAKSGK
jgi:hypothetical protein